MIISHIIKSPIRIPSTNVLYLPMSSGRKKWMFKNPDIVKYCEDIAEACGDIFSPFQSLEIAYIDLYLIFLLKDRIWVRDVTNMVKATEDGFVKGMGVDDRWNRVVSSIKTKSFDKNEYIIIIANAVSLKEAESA